MVPPKVAIELDLTIGCDQQKRELANTSAPIRTKIINYESMSLAVRATEEDPLKFGKSWTSKQCEDWLRGHFEKVFEFMEENCARWSLLGKEGKKLTVANIKKPNGNLFWELKGCHKANIEDSKIYFGEYCYTISC